MTNDIPDFSSAKEFISEEALTAEMEMHGSVELFSIVSRARRFEKDKSFEHIFSLGIQSITNILKYSYVIVIAEKFGEGTQIWNFDSQKILEAIKKNWDTYKRHSAESNIEIAFVHEKFKDNLIKSRTNPIVIITDPALIYS